MDNELNPFLRYVSSTFEDILDVVERSLKRVIDFRQRIYQRTRVFDGFYRFMHRDSPKVSVEKASLCKR